MLTLGNLQFQNGLMLAPLAGYTDHAARAVCHEAGAEYSVSEMVSAKAICYGDKKTPLLSRVYEDDGPVAVQLFGADPAFIAEAARRLYASFAGGVLPAAFDVNMGCPMPKITNNGEGCALMKSPALVEKIVSALVAATPLPVTVKIRAGWDENCKNAPDVARAAEAGGASAICVHGRTRAQLYTGLSDARVIAAVKSAVSIPVIGNGDVCDVKSALSLFENTGCDGIAVGRAAVKNPFLFRAIAAALAGKTVPLPTGEERYALAMKELRLRCEEKGEERGVQESRKQMVSLLNGFAGASAARQKVIYAATFDEMARALSPLKDEEICNV